jgi:hypothetical protein
MADNIRLLEDLVAKAVDRLQLLSQERERLRNEVEALRGRLETLERQATDRDSEAWRSRRDQALIRIRETLAAVREG